MNTHKVTEIFIGNGAALDATNISIAALTKQIAIVGQNMNTLNPSVGESITTDPSIFIVNKLANADLKRSMEIKGTSVSAYKGQHYKPSRREVWGIGHQRGSVVDGVTTAAGGSIIVNCDTEYSLSIVFKNDKIMFSERPETLRVSFTSSATATQSSIADQIVNSINNSGYGTGSTKQIKAVKVGDGTGIFGLTGAVDFGVEIWGLDINQFQNTTYRENIVYFSVHVDDSTGFGATTSTLIQHFSYGTGTYNQVFNMENFYFQYEGVLNRTKWPIPTLEYLALRAPILSGTVAAAATLPTGNVTATINSDLVTVTSTLGLRAGELITINAVAYEIKYIVSATSFVITVVASATYTGAELKVKYLYNILNIEVTDVITTPGANVGQFAKKVIVIATPSIDAGAADPFDRAQDAADTSAECIDLLDILDPWMASTPLAPAAITLI